MRSLVARVLEWLLSPLRFGAGCALAASCALAPGCGPERTLEIADARQTLAEIMGSGPEHWSITGGSLGLSPTGSHQFPFPLTMRLRSYELCGHDNGDECFFDIASGSIEVAAGSPCGITIPTSCSGIECFAELEVTGLGNCLLAVQLATTDDHDDSTCWYRAAYEADDPYDDALFAMYDAKTEREVSDCKSNL